MPGLVAIKSNADLVREEQESARQADEARQSDAVVTGLAGYVRKCWDAAYQAKQPIQERMIKCLRARQGQYSDSDLALILEQGGQPIFMMLTDEKCTAAISWLEDLILPADDDPWGIKPTPAPDLSPQHKQEIVDQVTAEARQDLQAGFQVTPEIIRARLQQLAGEIKEQIARAAREEEKEVELAMKDEVAESGWRNALADSIDDLVTYPAGVLKGPILRMKPGIVWGEDGRPTVETGLVKEFERVSPMDIYPMPSSRDINDGGMFEHHRLTRVDLLELKGVPGYDDAAIDMVLEEAPGGLTSWLWILQDQERSSLEGSPREWTDPEGKIDALQYWGTVQGQMLVDWGMDEARVPDLTAEYQAEIWLIGSHVIKAELNGNPLGRKPYHKASFRKVVGGFWGQGLPEVIADIQDVCNASARALVRNMGIASGPQVGVDVGAMPAGENVTQIYPWKVWQFDMTGSYRGSGSGQQPMWFFQPDSHAEQLMNVYEKFSQEAENKSGIPRYSYGQGGGGGAVGTATGLTLMLGNASRGIKKVVANIDRGMIEPSIVTLHQWLQLYSDDPVYLRGDVKIIARGSSAMVAKEQATLRTNEFYGMLKGDAAAQQIVGMRGYAEVLRQIARNLKLDVDKFVPSDDVLMQREQQAQLQAAMQPAQGALPLGQGQTPEAAVEMDAAGNVAGGGDVALYQGQRG